MKRFKKILVATDSRLEDHPICDEAVKIAQRNGASLTLVDTVPELLWTVRMAVQNHEHIRELIGQEKQQKLDQLAEKVRAAGVPAETKVLWGKTSVEIIREVLRSGHDLVLRVAKGSSSRRSGFFGNTGIRLLRKCPCAVWLVSPAAAPRFKHVLGCIDTSTGDSTDAELNDKIYELTSSVSQYHGGRFSIVQVWSVFGERIFKGRMRPEEFEEIEQKHRQHGAELLDEFLQQHGDSSDRPHVHLLKGEPQDEIPRFVAEQGVDLVVMGTVGRSGLVGMIMGNTSEQILSRIACSVLALKPGGFQCPITLPEEEEEGD